MPLKEPELPELEPFFKILVYGYGNPGRQDDGLGIELVRALEEWTVAEGKKGIFFESNYQLNIEDAELIAGFDLVIFADASVEEIGDVALSTVSGEKGVTYTTHAASPGYVLKLAEELFGKSPAVYLVHIRGYEWELHMGVTGKARKNLDKAVRLMKLGLENPALFESWADQPPALKINNKNT